MGVLRFITLGKYTDDLSLAYSLNIPMRMLYCDYNICMFHHHLIGKTDPKLIKFWFPALKPECFKSLCSEDRYNPSDTWDATAQKIALMTRSSIKEIMDTFEEVGFPVNEEFTPSNNLIELRNKWGFETDEKGILVSMGKNGVHEIENVFSKLAESPKHSIKIRYVFVCGTNDLLKQELEKRKLEKNLSETALERVSIHGYITLQEMAEVMNLAILSIGKPGGASSSEHRALGLPMFVMCSHQWESGNERQMSQEGLIERYNENEPLHLQIEKCLLKDRPEKPVLIDWKARIIQNISILQLKLF